MPDMTGYEVAKRIRSERWGTHLKLIALTGWAQENDRRLAREAEFDHHLTKPIDPDRLRSILVPDETADQV